MKILYLTMEYHAQFSGNGAASVSFVRALRLLGHEVFVICGALREDVDKFNPEEGACCAVGSWRVHGMTGPWEEWAEGVGEVDLNGFQPDSVIGVDWEANKAYKTLVRRNENVLGHAPYTYYNYRVYHKNTGNTDDETAFYLEQEREACSMAKTVLCLSRPDKASLEQITGKRVDVILPGLREEIKGVVGDGGDRRYLLCCVRVVKEKNAGFFVDLVERVAGLLVERGVVPYMVGASDGKGYGDEVKARLNKAGCKAIISDFVTPPTLAHIMRHSLLNIHPSLNEAYGMTIIEAASLGCPTLCHHTSIGATELLSPAQQEVLTTDMTCLQTAADRLGKLLTTPTALETVSTRARAKAHSYTEAENAQRLITLIS
eukprot:TRINITY_DN1457_c0_g1_i5.p1 TRINITY_DN1457_c0_g1~~TRINITY_DN1457_c0_g1_i5.p1  ORF type:complete len:388 (+),score=79.93 TRINITY_DN1457_c0_g1_i5:45-1166(+)